MSRMLIGINGEIGCGKSTAVNYLKKYGFVEYNFAKPLKDTAVVLGFEPHQVYGNQEQKLEVNQFWGITGREFLQKFGSEVCRDYVPKVFPNMRLNNTTMWVRLFEKFYADTDNNVAVGDVRFADESQKIKELGGVVIRIDRPKEPVESMVSSMVDGFSDLQITDGIDSSYLKHQSETQANNIFTNIVIHNNGTLEELYNKLDHAMVFIAQGINNVDNLTVYM